MELKRILLIVGGGVAAYKACHLARELMRQGAKVRTVLTQAGARFVTPLSFEALTLEPCLTELWNPRLGPMEHIELARWAQAILVAPATADRIAQMAAGFASDLAGAVLLASPAPLAVAPAMNPQMWAHPATQANVEILRQRGVGVLGPASGEMACQDVGPGRLLEPEVLTRDFLAWAEDSKPSCHPRASSDPRAEGLRVRITAGPTREHLDPARFLSNPSTGTMGCLVAEAFWARGAEVSLILGPVSISPPEGVQVRPVVSAAEMYEATLDDLESFDVVVAAAAVADWTPREVHPEKQKKLGESRTLELVRTQDILAEVSRKRRPGQVLVGFAAESHEVLARGRGKLERKDLDLLLANQIGIASSGFGSQDNFAQILERDVPDPGELESCSKREWARRLVDRVLARREKAAPR